MRVARQGWAVFIVAFAAGAEPAVKLRGGKIEARVLVSPESGASNAALALLEVAPGAELTLQKHAGGEVLYVLSGRATVTHPVTAKWLSVGEREAVYLPPGAVHGFVARGSAPVQLLRLWAPAGPERRLRGEKDPSTQDVGRADKVEGPLPIQAGEAKQYKVGDGLTVQILFDKQVTGDGSAHLARFTVSAGAAVPPHRHPEAEILYVLSGTATVTVAGAARELVPGEAIHIPPKARHGLSVTSTEPLKALQFFAPSPEARFGGATVKKPGGE